MTSPNIHKVYLAYPEVLSDVRHSPGTTNIPSRSSTAMNPFISSECHSAPLLYRMAKVMRTSGRCATMRPAQNIMVTRHHLRSEAA